MSGPITPSPKRSGKAGVSLRTQRPTTYYDGERDASMVPFPTEGGRKPPRPAAMGEGFSGDSRPSPKAGHSNRLPPADNATRGMPVDRPSGTRPTERVRSAQPY
ncbi:hypothetical protein KEM48_009786 [Puccinia striiformis f. sp. tritici PST-130]|nr:hypothetical protein KEM48_009786 [Puccinia striiformis f. sp. tritici PST-130]